MSNPFAQPGAPTGDPFDWQANSGRLLMLEVTEYLDHVPTVHTMPGEKSPAVRANITVIDGPTAGLHARDSLVFPKVLQGQLRNSLGKLILGRLHQGAAKPGKSPAWELAESTPADQATAQAWLAAHRQPATTSAQPPF